MNDTQVTFALRNLNKTIIDSIDADLTDSDLQGIIDAVLLSAYAIGLKKS